MSVPLIVAVALRHFGSFYAAGRLVHPTSSDPACPLDQMEVGTLRIPLADGGVLDVEAGIRGAIVGGAGIPCTRTWAELPLADAQAIVLHVRGLATQRLCTIATEGLGSTARTSPRGWLVAQEVLDIKNALVLSDPVAVAVPADPIPAILDAVAAAMVRYDRDSDTSSPDILYTLLEAVDKALGGEAAADWGTIAMRVRALRGGA